MPDRRLRLLAPLRHERLPKAIESLEPGVHVDFHRLQEDAETKSPDPHLPPDEAELARQPELLEQPFWLDPSDRHHMASAIQFLTRPRAHSYWVVSDDPRHLLVRRDLVGAKAVRRVAADGFTPEQAVDHAIARIKQILSE